jgi:thiamine-phosphate pyrophosphorylase
LKTPFYIQVLTWDEVSRSHLEQVQCLIAAGASWIQLRQKKGTYDEKRAVASACVALCKKAAVTLIINDDPCLCLECGADGVHLGLSDMPIAEARALLGPHCIIGGTANTPNQVTSRMDDGADYVGVGPWRFTGLKKI